MTLLSWSQRAHCQSLVPASVTGLAHFLQPSQGVTTQTITFIDADTDLDMLLATNSYVITGRYFIEEGHAGYRVTAELRDGGEQFLHTFRSVKAGYANARRFVTALEQGEVIFGLDQKLNIEIDGNETILTCYR